MANAFIKAHLGTTDRPPMWLYVAERLLRSADASSIWNVLGGEDERRVLEVVRRVAACLEAALKEPVDIKVSDQRADIEGVIKLAKNLKAAVRRSKLPRDTAIWQEAVKGIEQDDEAHSFFFVWYGSSPRFRDIFAPVVSIPVTPKLSVLAPAEVGSTSVVSLEAMLDVAIEKAESHLQGLPQRAVTRRTDDPQVTAFVRHLV